MPQFLPTVTVGDLVATKQATYCIDVGATLQTAIETMSKYNVLSLPVTGPNGNIEGMITIMDLIVFVAWGPYFEHSESAEPSQTKLSSTVKSLMGLTGESRTVHVLDSNFPLVSLVVPFTSGLHRVLVRVKSDDNQTAYRVLSQSDVVKLLYTRKSEVSVHMARKLSELVSPKKVISIDDRRSALDAFKEMSISKVAAVAVTDCDTNEIIGNISASDLRGINLDTLQDATLPVMAFLRKTRGHAFKLLTVTMDNTLGDAVKLIAENNVHRLWIIAGSQNKDSPYTPIGVLSLSDIFRTFFPPQLQQPEQQQK